MNLPTLIGSGTLEINTDTGSEGRKKREVKFCGQIDGIPVQCAGDTLAAPPVETTAVSDSVVFENKFIDIFAGTEAEVRKVHRGIMYGIMHLIILV